jgi:phosphatidylglycerol:prolipoprotein diacylglycerol transferase
MTGGWFALRAESRYGFPKDTMLDYMLLAIPMSIVGARLYYVAFQWDYYKQDLLRILNIREGGLAIYGGVIAGFIAAWIIARRKHIPLWRMLDALAPSLAIGQAIGRWGNYTNMEAYGLPITNPSLQFFPYGVEIFTDGAWKWYQAAFFYESLACFIIFLILWYISRRNERREAEEGRHRNGSIVLLYFLLYGTERTFVEGLRQDSLMMGGVRVSQLLSVGVAVIALVILIYKHYSYCKERSGAL